METYGWILVLIFFSLAQMPVCAAPQTEASNNRASQTISLKPGEWYEVSNSNMARLTPQPPPGGHTSTSDAIMSAWSGGAYDTKRDRLIIFGGGHADYGGNELYAFEVKTLSWKRLTNPSPTTLFCGQLNKAFGQTDLRWNADGTPVSRHTYDGIQYIPSLDRLWVLGGSPWCTGASDNQTWLFDFDRLKWEKKTAAPINVGTPVSAYDPVTGNIYTLNQTTLIEYNPRDDSWKTRSNPSWQNGENTAEIDPVRRRFIVIGGGASFYYDLNKEGILARKQLVTTGDTEIVYRNAPGLVYDPINDVLVAWNGAVKTFNPKTRMREAPEDGSSVYVLDLDTLVWKKIKARGAVKPPAVVGNSPNGTFGRWQYIPSFNAFIGVNSIDSNVFFYKMPVDVTKRSGVGKQAQ